MRLHRQRDALQRLNAEVLLITFSGAAQARRWQDETGIDFPMLIDANRSAYRAYGLRSSVWRVWQPKVWLRYVRMMLRGWQWRGIQDDPHQLGADFIVDADGALRFAHWSEDPTDRPGVDALLSMLQQVQSWKGK
jgi:peroxiredoxin